MFLSPRRFVRLIPLVSILLTACGLHTTHQTSGQSPDSPQWHDHQQIVGKITHYQTRGAFAYLSGQQKVYARFNWQQTASDRYRLLLTNPLGSTELQLDQQGQIAQIVDNKGQRYVSHDATLLIEQLTGMTIPLDNLRQWMLGLPGDATDYSLDDQYRLRELNYQQDNHLWHVTYQNYDNSQTPALPASLELQEGEQRIKLKMDSWTVQ